MGILDLFRRGFGSPTNSGTTKTETRSSGAGYTAQIMAARESYISGVSGLAELTGTVQACVSLWEAAFATADVDAAPILDRRTMAVLGRALAVRGEFVGLIRPDRIVPASDWEVSTRDGIPRAYRLGIGEAGGARSETALAAEVLHVRIGCDPVAPWVGTAPLRRASLSARMLQALEEALTEVYATAPLGSQIVPFPESPQTDLENLGRDFRARRGRVLLRESVAVTAAGGPAPATDWRPQDVTPDLAKAMPMQALEVARGAVCAAFGVLPSLFDKAAQGPLVREAQRHLAQWTLEPVAKLISEEAQAKLGGPVRVDVVRPLQAYDASGKARALATIVEAMATAKERGLTPGEFAQALNMLDLE